MKTGKRKVYWDTSVLIAWLMNETCWPNSVVAGMQDVVLEVESDKCILVVSSVTRTEIFYGDLTPEQQSTYDKLMQRRNVQEVSADQKVTMRASKIREYFHKKEKAILTPDAIHLATGVIYEVDEFQTLDGFEKKGSKRTHLLSLSGDVDGYPLKIVPPYPHHSPPRELVEVKGPLFVKKTSEEKP